VRALGVGVGVGVGVGDGVGVAVVKTAPGIREVSQLDAVMVTTYFLLLIRFGNCDS
jgi:hypothetical protein